MSQRDLLFQPSKSADARLAQILAHTGVSRAFIADVPLRYTTRDGVSGVDITVRLTSYRALPLSCIAGIAISIDGKASDPAALRLVIYGVSYSLKQLGALSETWWFILDTATLFVPTPMPLPAGSHEIAGTLETIEPYVTAGRFAFHNSSIRTLTLEEFKL